MKHVVRVQVVEVDEIGNDANVVLSIDTTYPKATLSAAIECAQSIVNLLRVVKGWE
jgi:hypothetical protein